MILFIREQKYLSIHLIDRGLCDRGVGLDFFSDTDFFLDVFLKWKQIKFNGVSRK